MSLKKKTVKVKPMLINRAFRTWVRDYGSLFIKKMQEKERREHPAPPPPPLTEGISIWAIGSTFVIKGATYNVVDNGNNIVDGIYDVEVTK